MKSVTKVVVVVEQTRNAHGNRSLQNVDLSGQPWTLLWRGTRILAGVAGHGASRRLLVCTVIEDPGWSENDLKGRAFDNSSLVRAPVFEKKENNVLMVTVAPVPEGIRSTNICQWW